MANKKISDLSDGNPAENADQIPVNRGGTNYKITAETVSELVFSNAGPFTVPVTTLVGGGTSGQMPLYIPPGTLVADVSAGNDIGGIEFAGHTFYGTQYKVRRSFDMTHNIVVADTTVAATVTPTVIYTATQAANYLTAGKCINMHLMGVFTTGANGRTCTIELKQGATVLATVATPSATVTNSPFNVEFVVTIRTAGAGGTAITYAQFDADNTGASSAASGATAIDTTVSNVFTVVATWSTATGTSLTVQQGHTNTLG